MPLLALAAVALIAAGCGDDDEGEDGMRGANGATQAAPGAEGTTPERAGDAVTVELAEFSFDPEDVQVERGATIEARNVGQAPHNLTIERGPNPNEPSEELAATPTFDAGAEESITVEVDPGTYALVCTVPGHREAGMVGKITIR